VLLLVVMLLCKYHLKFKSTVIQKVTFLRLIKYHRQQKSVIVIFKGIFAIIILKAYCDKTFLCVRKFCIKDRHSLFMWTAFSLSVCVCVCVCVYVCLYTGMHVPLLHWD
jgi:predicted membrane-bound mannosyltransferase